SGSALRRVRADQRHILGEGVTCAGKRQLIPGHFTRRKGPHLQGLIHRLQFAANYPGKVDDDDDRIAGIGVHVEQPRHLDLEIDLFPGLADGGVLNPLALIEEPTRENPLAVTRLNGAFEQNDLIVEDGNSTGSNLGVVVEKGEGAGLAPPPRRFAGFESPPGQRAAALGAEAKLQTMMVMVFSLSVMMVLVSHDAVSFLAFLS